VHDVGEGAQGVGFGVQGKLLLMMLHDDKMIDPVMALFDRHATQVSRGYVCVNIY